MSSEPSISPERLRSFRLARNWSLDELANRLTQSGRSISRQALHQIETGKTSPTPVTFRALAAVLNIRSSDLLESSFSLQFVAFRKTSKLGKKAQEAIKAEFSHKAENRRRLVEANGIQTRSWSLDKRRVDTTEGAEEIARWLRDEWRLGRDAISSLTDACEHNGVEVVSLAPKAEGFSGLSAFETESQSAFIAIQQRSSDGARQRMDLAHELAHLVLAPDSAVEEEAFAKRFAGALLLPAETVQAELGAQRHSITFSELRALKLRYGVSMQGWIRRAFDLHIISQGTYKGLQIAINRYGLRADEGEPYVKLEACDRDARLAVRAVTEGALDATEAARLAGVSIDELINDSIPVQNARLASLSREQRREAARQAAAFAADEFQKHPESLTPDLMDHAD